MGKIGNVTIDVRLDTDKLADSARRVNRDLDKAARSVDKISRSERGGRALPGFLLGVGIGGGAAFAATSGRITSRILTRTLDELLRGARGFLGPEFARVEESLAPLKGVSQAFSLLGPDLLRAPEQFGGIRQVITEDLRNKAIVRGQVSGETRKALIDRLGKEGLDDRAAAFGEELSTEVARALGEFAAELPDLMRDLLTGPLKDVIIAVIKEVLPALLTEIIPQLGVGFVSGMFMGSGGQK